MRFRIVRILLMYTLLVILTGFTYAQDIIAPPSPIDAQIPAEIIMGLVGKYVTMIQQYQSAILRGGEPDSSIEFRLGARILIPGEEGKGFGIDLPDTPEMTFWVKANILASHPYLSRINLSGSLGNMEVLVTQTEVLLVSYDDAVFSVIPMRPSLEDMVEMLGIGGIASEGLPGEGLGLLAFLGLLQQDFADLLPQYFAGVDMEYYGQELTSKGVAHIVRLTYADSGLIVTLWILDDTWDLCKVGFDDPAGGGGSAIMVIDEIELMASTLPDSAFDVDTAGLTEVQLNDFISLIGLKAISISLAGMPVVADLSLSASEMRQGEMVIVSSNGLDTEDKESDLVPQIEYRSSGEAWTSLPAGYAGTAPFGRWEAVFGPPITEDPGIYDFRVTYADSSGAVSDPLELLAALKVVPIEFPVLALKPSSQVVMPGDVLTIRVVAESVSQLSSFSLTVGFDANLLQLLKVERTSFATWRPRPRIVEKVDMWRPTIINKEKGLITLAADSTRSGGVTGTGTIATLTFRAIGLGKSAIQLRDVTFTNAAGKDISLDLRDSEAAIIEFRLYDVNGDGVVNILDLISIQVKAQASPDVADSYELGLNYPNPFNPETWIPYQLAEDSNVVIRIYNSLGQLVKTLDLGYMTRGRYNTRDAAAYWDGTNEAGDRVASGIYYYRISAGRFSAIRKMVSID